MMIHKLKYIILVICSLGIFSSTIAQVYGGEKNDKGISFCQINKNYFLTGITRSYGSGSDDIWMLKVNSEYEVIDDYVLGNWVHYDVPSKILATSQSEIVVCGYSWDAPGTGARGDIVLCKYDTVGNNIWTSYFGGKKNDYSSGLIETKDKGYLLTGINRAEGDRGAAYLIKVNNDGVKEWEQFYNTANKDMGMDVIQCADSSFMVLVNVNTFVGKSANSSEYLSTEATKLMIVKTDKLGNEVWRKFYGGEKFDFGSGIISNGKDYYFVGSSMNNSNGSFDVVLYKINKEGDILLTKNYGGIGYEYGKSIDINEKGEILLGGYSNSFSSDSVPDLFLVKVDSLGNLIWEETYGGSFSDYGEQALFLSGGNNEIGFIGTSTVMKGDKMVTDLFFIKISSDGEQKTGVIAGLQQVSNNYTTSFNVLVYPNPARDQFFIKTSETIIGDNIFKLFDVAGNLIKTEQVLFNPFLVKLGTSISPGVYFYQLESKGSFKSGRIVLND